MFAGSKVIVMLSCFEDEGVDYAGRDEHGNVRGGESCSFPHHHPVFGVVAAPAFEEVFHVIDVIFWNKQHASTYLVCVVLDDHAGFGITALHRVEETDFVFL